MSHGPATITFANGTSTHVDFRCGVIEGECAISLSSDIKGVCVCVCVCVFLRSLAFAYLPSVKGMATNSQFIGRWPAVELPILFPQFNFHFSL